MTTVRIEARPYAAKVVPEIPEAIRHTGMSAQWLLENWEAKVVVRDAPYIEYLEFESEEAYTLFLLRWS